ncbi:phosphatidate cytidylyltransferase [Pseudorhodobacter sp. E13]|uniref:phosphatidate cytidylyltransferase n=1 Tax=Pseudorhodobacter sp. E13 TaxID=2487931 RepID=UPI000F8D2F04|nr:phosphatidate cytidylyltransferase [Pseudorhodobacter sp. E13]RUS60598.1 phosphatidate cytidylyltransferase [Pseudorhodobacter sp. E13]
MTAASNRWADLRPRMISAAVMAGVGAVEIWAGGWTFSVLVVALTGLMLWELGAMTRPDVAARDDRPRRRPQGRLSAALGVLGALCLALTLVSPQEYASFLLLVPALAFALTARRDRRLSTLWAAGVMVAGFGLMALRNDSGTPAIVWLVLVVVVSDIMGYFAGRILGGPKFWPAISPKKTWSGTVAGWLGAAVVGAVFWQMGYASAGLILLSALVSFAGQMGDIAESWIKRRTGVKDSSNMIPGHGGFLDRFDAMTGAVVAVMLLSLLMPLPLPVGG